MKFEKVDLVKLIGRVCDFYRRAAARKRIEILFRKPAASIPQVRTDRIAVAAILDNLLSNAVKFSAPGKRVWVEVRPGADRISCRVRDEGPGIRMEDRARLFQRGARLEAKPTAGESSTGYGLAVAAELAAHIEATSDAIASTARVPASSCACLAAGAPKARVGSANIRASLPTRTR